MNRFCLIKFPITKLFLTYNHQVGNTFRTSLNLTNGAVAKYIFCQYKLTTLGFLYKIVIAMEVIP